MLDVKVKDESVIDVNGFEDFEAIGLHKNKTNAESYIKIEEKDADEKFTKDHILKAEVETAKVNELEENVDNTIHR